MAPDPVAFVVPAVPERADRDALLRLLAAYEAEKAGPLRIEQLAILIKDEAGATIGGLYGWTMFRWLMVESLFVPERLRGSGTGTALMAQAESTARARDCIGIWLDTYDFQAPGFYAKLGFEAFGAVEDHPPGHRRIFMRKRWG
ncbi:MAG TPA: GNAT family N-acetyltransferase [Lichenihabitans sp.]|jgi:GNAT superfamily N-acetyltransferase|nr:GNAT family N-acetyltransferase [Lichenihabitans sp.]